MENELTTDTKLETQTFANRSYNVSRTAVRGFVSDLEKLSQAIHKRLTTQPVRISDLQLQLWH